MPKLLIVYETGYLPFAGAGQPVLPGRGAAQGLAAAIAVAAPSSGQSVAPDDPLSLNSTRADASMNASATLQIYTSLTARLQSPVNSAITSSSAA
jgi:hypothetical protein